ncbi:acyl-CoA dehydrogenase family protein [Streptomyces sp. NPDC008196]|uniref:acyl-CoA dehydrogenase family protein n=1 Tax=Streptomyces sp. NPDC008196 TaxID=3364819 RepID=UPI0036E41A33
MTAETAAVLIERAQKLRNLIRDQAEEAERLGHYTPAVHEAFQEAGFYRLLTPRRYGGLEVDVRTFAQVIMEVGRGDPGTAWCLCLGQGHALSVAAHWPERAQDEVFTNEHGYFRASHAFNPAGTATRVEGGWLVNARSRYQSGVPYASHATVSVLVGEEGAPPPVPGGPVAGARLMQILIPAGQFTIADDWGGDRVLGMRASGSNSVIVEQQVVPEHYGIVMDPDKINTTTSPGVRLHGNPMYLGAVTGGFFVLELVVSVVGAARAALDEFEHLARTRNTTVPGGGPRFKDPLYQRDFGEARLKANAAEAIVCHTADLMTEWSRESVEGRLTITAEMGSGLGATLMQAGHLAAEAVDTLFNSAGTSASGQGQRMQRYLRDVAMWRTHIGAQYHTFARQYGAHSFGEAHAWSF